MNLTRDEIRTVSEFYLTHFKAYGDALKEHVECLAIVHHNNHLLPGCPSFDEFMESVRRESMQSCYSFKEVLLQRLASLRRAAAWGERWAKEITDDQG